MVAKEMGGARAALHGGQGETLPRHGHLGRGRRQGRRNASQAGRLRVRGAPSERLRLRVARAKTVAEARGGRREARDAARAKYAAASASPRDRPAARSAAADRFLESVHVVPQGGALAVECSGGTWVRQVSFASYGAPVRQPNGSLAADPACHLDETKRVVEEACLGQSHCCLPIADANFPRDPCRGRVKSFAAVLVGCDLHLPPSRYKTHCALSGQPMLPQEDVEFLAALQLPPAPEPVPPAVAIMVDTTYRPELQSFVVQSVRRATGWPVQIFTGPTAKPQLATLFAAEISSGALSLTDLGDDYMEDWVRLSSMMLIPTFWEAVRGKKALVFQPDSVMCGNATRSIDHFVQYDYVGPPMSGPWWMTSDDPSQWSVGCGGFSLRDRALSIRMSNTPACITPAAGKFEDQQLGTMWKRIEARCADAGITVRRPSRFEAVEFGVEYDLHMDVLPGEAPQGYPPLPSGCTANFYTGPKYQPHTTKRKWQPTPLPSPQQCPERSFVPMACHKCWFWNQRTWRFMKRHCPEVTTLRQLRRKYEVGTEFTGFPKRPKPTPRRGAIPPDQRYLPHDMLQGRCHGRCEAQPPPTGFERTVRGDYLRKG